MILPTLAPLFLLVSLVTANRVHRLKLHKIQPVAFNPAFESAYLAEKYRDELFWTKQPMNAGHGVPLTSGPDSILMGYVLIRRQIS
jgi:saccharopepsin